jgi:hypothetical protein
VGARGGRRRCDRRLRGRCRVRAGGSEQRRTLARELGDDDRQSRADACTDLLSDATEYYHRSFDHYFVTAFASEVRSLDSGAVGGWERTGESFTVRPLGTAGASNVCRYWSGQSFAPKSSHFFSPFDWECVAVRQNPDWQLEGEVFAVDLPSSTGTCKLGTVSVYRLFNEGKGGAPNHRYTTSAATRSAMIAQGWTPEGSGIGVIGCVPMQ